MLKVYQNLNKSHFCSLQLKRSLKLCYNTRQKSSLEEDSLNELNDESISKTRIKPLNMIRNIGISAHIDSGKTTLTERLLYYSGKIDEMHEVKGKDKVGAVMDSMELERQRGITIQSAATYINWKSNTINIIDTPGHVDFTVEVERALRVLDGAVLVLCAVGGVQAQTFTVTRQMSRYNVPCIAFVNKVDRQNANHERVLSHLKERIGYNAAFVNIPMGLESKNKGVIDILKNKALYFEGSAGTIIREDKIPDEFLEEREIKKQALIEAVSNVDDTIGELFLNEKPISDDELIKAIRRATISRQFVPVFTGTALKNKGVQPVLDGVIDYLPNPSEVDNFAILYEEDGSIKEKVKINTERSDKHESIALAFKNETSKFGKLTYFRIYQGCVKKGDFLKNTRTNKRIKVPRLVRIHSNTIEDIKECYAGDIVGLSGIECATGDTFVPPTNTSKIGMEPIFIPEPVISMSVYVKDKNKTDQFSKALNRYCNEDPTLHRTYDTESKETILSGMGELHLEIYSQRIEKEYNCPVELRKPKVAFRETITKPCTFNYLHKRQTGGRGQFGRVIGVLEPLPPNQYKDILFSNETVGTNVPRQFVPHIEKGYRATCEKGPLTGHKISGIKFRLIDGDNHPVDSNDIAFFLAAEGALQNTFIDGSWTLIEPIMLVEVTCPVVYQGEVTNQINKRNGIISQLIQGNEFYTLIAEVPLNDMFGYSTELRIATQGQGEYSMEYKRYAPVRDEVRSRLTKEYQAYLDSLEK